MADLDYGCPYCGKYHTPNSKGNRVCGDYRFISSDEYELIQAGVGVLHIAYVSASSKVSPLNHALTRWRKAIGEEGLEKNLLRWAEATKRPVTKSSSELAKELEVAQARIVELEKKCGDLAVALRHETSCNSRQYK